MHLLYKKCTAVKECEQWYHQPNYWPRNIKENNFETFDKTFTCTYNDEPEYISFCDDCL
jgi:hypothetical protein